MIPLKRSILVAIALSISSTAHAFEVLAPRALVEMLHAGEKVVFVDVREPAEFAVNHIPGAINLPQREFEARRRELDPDAILIPYCNMDFRGFVSARALEQLGFERVALMQERGLHGWREQGLPVVGRESGLTDAEALAKLRDVAVEDLASERKIVRVQPTGRVHEIEMEVAEWYFEPNDLTVEPGDRVRIDLTSAQGDHQFILPDFEVAEVVKEGDTRTIEFVASHAGDFRFGTCEWDGDELQVMKGRLRVVAPAAGQGGQP